MASKAVRGCSRIKMAIVHRFCKRFYVDNYFCISCLLSFYSIAGNFELLSRKKYKKRCNNSRWSSCFQRNSRSDKNTVVALSKCPWWRHLSSSVTKKQRSVAWQTWVRSDFV